MPVYGGRYDPTGAAVDGEGNVYVPMTDYSNSRALLLKYTAQGERASGIRQQIEAKEQE